MINHREQLIQNLKPLIYFLRIFGNFDKKIDSNISKFCRFTTLFTIPLVLVKFVDDVLFFKSIRSKSFLKATFLVFDLFQSFIFLIFTIELFIFNKKFLKIFNSIEEFLNEIKMRHDLTVNFKLISKFSVVLLTTTIVPIVFFYFDHEFFECPPNYIFDKWMIVLAYFCFTLVRGVAWTSTMIFPLMFLEICSVLKLYRFQPNYSYNFSKIFESIQCLKEKITKEIEFLTFSVILLLLIRLVVYSFNLFDIFHMNFNETAKHVHLITSK